MSAKKYALSVIALLYTFMIMNFALWHGYVKEMFMQRDLNRLGYFAGNEELSPEKEYLRHHMEMKEYLQGNIKASIDVITIGDSFSNGGGGNYYQDCLAEKYGINSLNYHGKNRCLDDLYMLISSGMIDEIHPKAVILEKVERGVNGEMGTERIKISSADKNEIYELVFKENTNRSRISRGILPPVMTEASINFLRNKLRRIYNSERLSSEVYITELDRNLFTNLGNEHTLLFYYYDLNYIDNPVNAEMINMNLNAAAEVLKSKGIKLIFMPCADKYDLYYPYIADKKGRPENNFFPVMREVQEKEYIFIDTKAILKEALMRGEKDLYWFGDTHWSWKGAEIICDELVKYLRP